MQPTVDPLHSEGRWVNPTTHPSLSWPIWKLLAENRFFKVFTHNPSRLTKVVDDPYRILFIATSKLVAVADHQVDIMTKFQALGELIDPHLNPADVGMFLDAKIAGLVIEQSILQREAQEKQKAIELELIKQQFGYSERSSKSHREPSRREDSRREESPQKMHIGVVPTLAVQDIGPERHTPITSFREKRSKSNVSSMGVSLKVRFNEIQTQFGLPKEENLIMFYDGLIWSPLPKPISVYVTTNYLCLSSEVPIPFNSLRKISRTGLNAVKYETATKEYSVSLLTKTVELFIITEQLWKRSMEILEKNCAFVKAENDQWRQNEHQSSEGGAIDLQEVATQVTEILSKESLTSESHLQNFCNLFGLPLTEKIVEEFKCEMYYSFNEKVAFVGTGQVYVSTSFVCFWTGGAEMQISTEKSSMFVLPFLFFDRFKMDKRANDFGDLAFLIPCNQIKIQCNKNQIFTIEPKEGYYGDIPVVFETLKRLTEAVGDTVKTIPDISVLTCSERPSRFDPALLANPYHFSPDFFAQEDARKESLERYFARHGKSFTFARKSELHDIFRRGIPLEYKASMWLIMSGACCHMVTRDKGYYQQMIKKGETIPKGIIEQIDKDLHRSLVDQLYFNQKESEGIKALRNVLLAYAAHNPVLGYCQSMNIVTAYLLLFCEEEESFYLLCAIIQRIPQYYTSEMTGSIVDMNVFRTLLRESYPALMTHFDNIGFDISFIAGPWFLCFYISHVPWEVVLRITDYFFIEGPNIFIQVGLAAFQLCEKELLQKKCIVGTIEYLNNVKFNTEELCTLAFKTLKMDHRNMSYLRNSEKVKCLEGHFHQTNRNIFLHLKQRTKFPVELVQKLHNQFKLHLPVGSMNSCLNKYEFERLFMNAEPSRIEVLNYPINLWKLFDKKNENYISFLEYVLGLDYIINSSFEENKQWIFSLEAPTEDGIPSYESLVKSLKLWFLFVWKRDCLERNGLEETYTKEEELVEQMKNMQDWDKLGIRVSERGTLDYRSFENAIEAISRECWPEIQEAEVLDRVSRVNLVDYSGLITEDVTSPTTNI